MSKLSTGYYEIFDPNNGFTAIDADYLSQLPLAEIDNRYFLSQICSINLTYWAQKY
jgi:hypothetical protein